MSWWVYLQDDTQPPWCSYGQIDFKPRYIGDEPCPVPCYPVVEVEAHSEGGTYVGGGTSAAELNITYNYSDLFAEAWDGVGLREALDGRRAGEIIPALEHAVAYLGTEQDADYWRASKGNAGYALSLLLAWARQHPTVLLKVS